MRLYPKTDGAVNWQIENLGGCGTPLVRTKCTRGVLRSALASRRERTRLYTALGVGLSVDRWLLLSCWPVCTAVHHVRSYGLAPIRQVVGARGSPPQQIKNPSIDDTTTLRQGDLLFLTDTPAIESERSLMKADLR